MGTDDAVRAEGLSKSYGRLHALREVDLVVPRGSFVLLTGPNGAGKSTLLRLLGGLARPSSGRVTVFGGDPHEKPSVRRRIGMLADQPMVYEALSAAENLRFYARLYGLPSPDARIRAVLDRALLGTRASSPVRTYSRGMKQRLAWERACLHSPDLLLLDEPFGCLDQGGAEQLRAHLREARARGVTCVLVTHQLEYAAGLADRQVRLDGGRVVAQQQTGSSPTAATGGAPSAGPASN